MKESIKKLINEYSKRAEYLDKNLHTDYAYYKAKEMEYADMREVELLREFIEELEEIKEEN